MTSKQVMLMVALAFVCGGCEAAKQVIDFEAIPRLVSPYPTRHVWAVAPLRNESGHSHADGLVLADHLARQLEGAVNLDLLPVNRVLKAMASLDIEFLETPQQAMQLLEILGVDGLIAGTITSYEPYDPPKLGLAIELYALEDVHQADRAMQTRHARTPTKRATGPKLDVLHRMTWSATGPTGPTSPGLDQPVSIVSAFFDAADPDMRQGIRKYAQKRGAGPTSEAWHLYHVSMDLYSEFVSYVMSWRLLREEELRMALAVTHPTP